MAEVINITDKIKVRQIEKDQDTHYKNHDYVLTACEEVFYEAVVVEVCEDGGINLSSTGIDHEDMITALLSAAFKVKEMMEEENNV